jgi:hypothetical protein
MVDLLLLDWQEEFSAESKVLVVQEYLSDTLTAHYVRQNNALIELAVCMFYDNMMFHLKNALRHDYRRAKLVKAIEDIAVFEIAGPCHHSY